MSKQSAHQLLNAAKAGLQVSMREITQALQETGDFDPPQQREEEIHQYTYSRYLEERIEP